MISLENNSLFMAQALARRPIEGSSNASIGTSTSASIGSTTTTPTNKHKTSSTTAPVKEGKMRRAFMKFMGLNQ
jgi:hypothetical protein